jgi:polyphenol oxidase
METIISPKSKVQSPKSEAEILAENGFFWRESGGVKVLVCRALEENGFANGFSTRLGGVSSFPANDLNLAGFGEDSNENIFENRRRFLKIFDGKFALATAWQIHGDDVKIVKSEADIKNSEEKADALASNLENVLVGVKTADCVPILIGDAKTRAFASVHAGWRGTALSIARKTIEKMRVAFGTNPADLICAVGPAATCKNYEIGREVIEAFEENFPNGENIFTPTRENHALIDLHKANKNQLLSAGVAAENIRIAPFCTMERTDLFFSYRVEKKLYGKTGRLISVIGRNG